MKEIKDRDDLDLDFVDRITNKDILPEKRLIRAVMAKALDDINDSDQNVRTESRDWVMEPYDIEKEEVYSLQYICNFLELTHSIVQLYAEKRFK